MTEDEEIESVILGLADPQWRRIVVRGDHTLTASYECVLQCGHVKFMSAAELYACGGNWTVCRQCTYSNS